MKQFLNFRTLVLLLGISFFISCKKEDTPTPTPIETAEEKLFKNIQGRWDIPPVVTRNQVPDPAISSIVFSADSTVFVVIHGSFITGTFEVKDSTSVDLKGPEAGQTATIRNIVITNNGISFTYTIGDVAGTFTASKVEDVAIANEDKAILGEWVLGEEGDISETWTFYSSGHFVRAYTEGDIVIGSWSFDSERDNVIIGDTFWGGFLKVTELTATALTVELIYTNGEGVEFKEVEFSFTKR